MIRAILTGDTHLGVYYARFRADRLEQRRQRLREALERVVDAAIEQRVDLFLHSGDLYDRPDPRNDDRSFFARQLARLNGASIPVVCIVGNHDTPKSYGYGAGAMPQDEPSALSRLHLLRTKDHFSQVEFTIRSQRVRVFGMSSDFNRPTEICALDGLKIEPDPDSVQIALLHYAAHHFFDPRTDDLREPMLTNEGLERLRVDAICMGHLHKYHHKVLLNGALLVNAGSTEHMSFGEEGRECGYVELTFEEGGTAFRHVQLATQPMETIDLRVPDEIARTERAEEVRLVTDNLLEHFRTTVVRSSDPDKLLRLRISGVIGRAFYQALDFGPLQQLGSQLNFHCQLETDDLMVIDIDNETLIGSGVNFDVLQELRGAAQRIIDASESPADREVGQTALAQVSSAYERLVGRTR